MNNLKLVTKRGKQILITMLVIAVFVTVSPQLSASEAVQATVDWNIDGVAIAVTATRPGYAANDFSLHLIGAVADSDGNELDTNTPARIVRDGSIFRVFALTGTATHNHIADALDGRSEFTASIHSGSSAVLDLPLIDLASEGIRSSQQDVAEPPTGLSGTFQISDYGTQEASGNFWWRGYIFEVSKETTITHLISAVTNGGTANVVLYEASRLSTTDGAGNTHIRGTTLLGQVTASGTGSEVTTPITVAGGGNSVTLVPGQLYLLAQAATSGQHVYVQNLDIPDLETHPRIKQGTWEPRNQLIF